MRSNYFEIATENNKGEWIEDVIVYYEVDSYDLTVTVEDIIHEGKKVFSEDIGLTDDMIRNMAEDEAINQRERNKGR